MSESTSGISIHTYERFDGSEWREYETDNYTYLLTGHGRQLLRGTRLHTLFEAYMDDYLNDREGPDDTRSFVGEGAHARVFSLGEDLAVKESNTNAKRADQQASLERMDHLIYVIQKYCPEWIDVPSHYGIVTPNDDSGEQFTIMKKVDHGVTVGDVIDATSPTVSRIAKGLLEPTAVERFGQITPAVTAEVHGRFLSLHDSVTVALKLGGLNPSKYTPDLSNNPYNVVVERLDTPVDDSYIKYWVIDQ